MKCVELVDYIPHKSWLWAQNFGLHTLNRYIGYTKL